MNMFVQYFNDTIAIGGVFTFSIVIFSVYFVNKSTQYLYLSGYFLLTFIILSAMQNTSLYPFNDIVERNTALPFLLLLSLPFLLLFLKQFLQLNSYVYVIKISNIFVLISCGITVLLPAELSYLITHLALFQTLFIFLAVNILLVKLKHDLEKHFTALTFIYGMGLSSNILLFGWNEFNGEIFALCYWLLSVTLLYLLNRQTILRVDKQTASEEQAVALSEKYQSSYKELLIQQEEDQELLESRVQERTLELNIALQELEEANRELEEKNTLDELTGLYNRRFYDQKILAEFRRSRRNLTPLSLVVIDIDHFKQVNDNYGHSAGDKCLVTLGTLIKQVLRRSSDIGCRYGGEEFCLILPETDSEGAVAFAQELRELVLSSSFEFDTTSINLTISCGVCTYQQQKDVTPVDIFDGADKALYQAKADGRNQVQVKEIIAAIKS
jgi:two-component system, sensor histidine kinase LadS